MMLTCNRFAIFPHMCHECKRYIWIEPYRRSDVFKHDRYFMENICKQCLPKFLDDDEASKNMNSGMTISKSQELCPDAPLAPIIKL